MAEFIARRFNEEDTELLRKVISYSSNIMRDEIEQDKGKGKQRQTFFNLMTKKSHFDVLLEQVETKKIDIAAIEAVNLAVAEKEIDELDEDEFEEIGIK